jgi:hypothetical protein
VHSFPSHLLLVDPEHCNEMEAGLEAITEVFIESTVTLVLLSPCPCSLSINHAQHDGEEVEDYHCLLRGVILDTEERIGTHS